MNLLLPIRNHTPKPSPATHTTVMSRRRTPFVQAYRVLTQGR